MSNLPTLGRVQSQGIVEQSLRPEDIDPGVADAVAAAEDSKRGLGSTVTPETNTSDLFPKAALDRAQGNAAYAPDPQAIQAGNRRLSYNRVNESDETARGKNKHDYWGAFRKLFGLDRPSNAVVKQAIKQAVEGTGYDGLSRRAAYASITGYTNSVAGMVGSTHAAFSTAPRAAPKPQPSLSPAVAAATQAAGPTPPTPFTYIPGGKAAEGTVTDANFELSSKRLERVAVEHGQSNVPRGLRDQLTLTHITEHHRAA